MDSIMWFRRDLRMEDNTALSKAFENSDSLLLIFHVNPEQFIEASSKNESAFFKTVKVFEKELKEKGAQLHFLYGDLEESFRRVKKEFPDWSDIYLNYDETGYGLKRDQKIAPLFKELGIGVHAYHDHYLHSAQEIKTNAGTAYKVFTPYYNKWIERVKASPIKVSFDVEKIKTTEKFQKDRIQFEEHYKELIELKDLKVSRLSAKERMIYFIENALASYHQDRDFPFVDGTSRLSHYLRTGKISIRTLYNEVMKAGNSKGKEVFIKELAWREFYNMVYATNPKQKNQAIKEKFNDIPWENNREHFEAWKIGKTGFPIVDAAMRQLNETGWMHNRLRMIVASFLTKDLLIDWRWGEKYFQEKLVDYDAASNIGGWQWAASTGTDAVPYFRIFNPVTQSERFDKEARFIKKYLPELKKLPAKKIHEPASLTVQEQDQYDVILGQDYPFPVVLHQERRKKAIAVYEESKDIYKELNRNS